MRARVFMAVVLIWVCIQTGEAWAKRNSDSGPGCGVGTLLWSDYDHPKNIAPQVLMFTTNATLFNTVSMSFGISGCTNDGVIMAEHKVDVFVASTYESLSQDMARGEGAHLASLAALLGVPPEQHQAFARLAQDRFEALLESGTAGPGGITVALREVMARHPELAMASRPPDSSRRDSE